MRRCTIGLISALLSVSLLSPAISWAQVSGQYRVIRMDNTYIEGEIEEVKDQGVYKIKTKAGVVTIKKVEVRKLVPLGGNEKPGATKPGAAAPVAAPNNSSSSGAKPVVSNAEIAAILGDTPADVGDSSDVEEAEVDHDVTLSANEESIAEMMRIAGSGAKRLETPRFVLVYTSDLETARSMSARLESVYRWVVRYCDMLGVPTKPPEHKLEIYFFGTHKEYEGYQSNRGFVSVGAIGFYSPDVNRSAFFDMNTWPPIASLHEQLKQPNLPFQTRRFIQNRIARWVEFKNLEVVQHEASHHIHFNVGLFVRDAFWAHWVVEGDAQLFEVPPSGEGAGLGSLNHYRLFQCRQLYGRKGTNFDRAMAGSDKPSDQVAVLRQFIFDDARWGGAESYPLGWAIHYYLFKKQREKYAVFMQRMAKFDSKEPPTPTERQREFEDLFGPVDAKFKDNLVAFLESLQLKQSAFEP
ncbi:MAG: DUF1570 domain-containing protein [Phycisphaerae bacterium]